MSQVDTECESMGARRRRLERQLADLRRARGQAVADGKQYDSSKITDVETAIAALDDGEAEQELRDATEAKVDRRTSYLKSLETYAACRARRIEAAGKAEVAFRAFCAELRKFIDANENERMVAEGLDRNSVPAELVRVNVNTRIASYMRPILRDWVGGPDFGGIATGALPSDIAPADSWDGAEHRVSDLSVYYKRRTPPAPE